MFIKKLTDNIKNTDDNSGKSDIKKILLIEDDVEDVYLIEEYFKLMNNRSYSLTTASKLEEGVSLLKKQKYEAVILDLTLPDCQGIYTFLRVQTVAPNTPIIVASGVSNKTFILQTLSAGAQDYLVKGKFDENHLHKSIEFSLHRMKNTYYKKKKKLEKYYSKELDLTKQLSDYYEKKFGKTSLSDIANSDYNQLFDDFSFLLEKQVKLTDEKNRYLISDDSLEFVKKLCKSNASGIDVLQMYTSFLEKKKSSVDQETFNLYIEIGRCQVFEIMAHLIIFKAM